MKNTTQEDEWPELLAWAAKYREDHKLIIDDFVELIGLDNSDSGFGAYLSGWSGVPSARDYTCGARIRNALRNFKARVESETVMSPLPSDEKLFKSVNNIWIEKGNGVFPEIILYEEKNNIINVIVQYVVAQRKPVTKQDLVDWFKIHGLDLDDYTFKFSYPHRL